jgi:ion channel
LSGYERSASRQSGAGQKAVELPPACRQAAQGTRKLETQPVSDFARHPYMLMNLGQRDEPFLTIGEVFRYILKRGPITADKLHGALSGYIMIAFLWTFIYALIESFTPGSFTLENVYSANDPHAFFRLLYFSFTTLTTVGYGDITPATDQARSFVMIEQFRECFS